MNQHFKRIASLCLLFALVFSLVGGVPFPKAIAVETEPGASMETGSSENLLAKLNPGFEDGLTNWEVNKIDNVATGSVVSAETEPENVFSGDYALKLTRVNGGVAQALSNRIPIEGGVTYRLSVYAKESYSSGSGWQAYIQYWESETAPASQRLAAFYSTTLVTGEWNVIDVVGAAPVNARFASILLTSGSGKETVYFDDVRFIAEGKAEWAPEAVDLQWDQIYFNYPRLDFDAKRLDEIKELSQSTDLNAYGYSGANALVRLLNNPTPTVDSADEYLLEENLELSYLGGVEPVGRTVVYPLHPKLEDPTERFSAETDPQGYKRYPYLTSFGSHMVARTQTLALAYAITGEEKYAERAVQYAVDMSGWAQWVGTYETESEKSSQASGYFLDCVMTVYDLCNSYAGFTEEKKEIVRTAILEKGLKAIQADCWPRMLKDRDMDHATGLILGACLIMDENDTTGKYTPEALKPYLDLGMTYINWRLDYFLKSGVNEGHMYDSLAIDDIVVTLYTLKRVTGCTGPFDHQYMGELEKRVLGFFEMTDGKLPAYSDSNYKSTYYPYSMAVLSQQGNDLATYYLATGGTLSSAYDQLVWGTNKSIAEVKIPGDRVGNVTYLGSHGQGALRTGWGTMDSLLVINANNTNSSHNHHDQNSIQLAFNGKWLLNDSEYKDNAYTDETQWQMKYTNSTIFVDGKSQVRLGQGSLQQVFNTHLYGYMIGSAPDAYGLEDKLPVLNKFDRHTIMVNHDNNPYYIIIDDLESNKDRTFGWNFYTNGMDANGGYWDHVQVDEQVVANGGSATGKRLTLSNFGVTLRSYFVGNTIKTNELFYQGDTNIYGPTLLAESTEKAKEYQFMNILSVEQGASTVTTKFTETNYTPRANTTDTIDKVGSEEMVMLSIAAGKGGGADFTFDFPADAVPGVYEEYYVTVDLGQTWKSDGLWNVYIETEANEDATSKFLLSTNALQGPEGVYTFDVGTHRLAPNDDGKGTVTLLLSGSANEKMPAILACASITLRKVGDPIEQGAIKVVEEWNDGDLLGAMINYGTDLNDIILFNRGTNTVTGGNLATNGQQASLLGMGTEGYAVTNGTSLKYEELVLMTADDNVSIALDATMAEKALNPVFYVSAKADTATTASIYLGKDAAYTAYIGDKAVPATYDLFTGMLTMEIPAGESQITIEGQHYHVWKAATCTEPKTCQLCGETEGEALGHTAGCTVCGMVAEGTCGDNLTWMLDSEGTLTISGTGAMTDFTRTGAPWYSSYRSEIKTVLIKDNVTKIGKYAFHNCTALTKVIMSDDVTEVNQYAFYRCTNLANGSVRYCGKQENITINNTQNTNFQNAAWQVETHTWEAATCGAPKTCSICGLTEGERLEHSWVKATCAEPVHCTLCNTAVGKAETHNWTDATCTTPKTCADCGATEGDALGHNEVIDPAVSATCTEAGLSEGKHCNRCDTVLTAQEEIPAKGHSFTNYVPDGNATSTQDGTKTAKCDNCDATDTIPDEGSMLIVVAKIGEKEYTSLNDAFAAAKAGDTVVLVIDATITQDLTLNADVTYEIPKGLTLTVAEGVTVTADAAATLNCAGTIVVAGYADISKLRYRTTFGACDGKLSIEATGTVVILDQWVNIWTPINDAQLGSMLENCEAGAKVVVGDDTWTLAETAWTHELHSYDGVITAPTCTKPGYTTYTCSVCGNSYTADETPATGEHNYVDGVCSDCGAKEPAEEVTGTITANGHSLSLEGNIWINKYVIIEGFEGVDLTKDAGLLIWTSEIAEEDAVFGTGNPIVKEGLLYNGLYGGKPEYGQLTDGIKAPFYGNKLYMRVYVKVGETYHYGAFTAYSVEDYCRGRIQKSSDAALKTLCAAVLEYGAMAQIRFSNVEGVNTEVLVNEGLDSSLKTEFSEEMIVALDTEYETKITAADTAIVSANGRSISLNEGLLINYYFKTTLTNIQSAELLTWDKEVEGELTYENATKTALTYAGGEYAASGALVPAPYCGDTIYACARFVDAEGAEYYTAVDAYSTHKYAENQFAKANLTEANRNLLEALIVYSHLANTKFAK